MRNLGAVTLLLAIVIGFGVYRGWFGFATERKAPEESKVALRVEVDTGKLKEDTATATQKAKELASSVTGKQEASSDTGKQEAQPKAESVKGEVVNVEAKDRRLTVATPDQKTVTIVVEANTKLRLKDADIPLTDVRAGDRVTVAFVVKDGNNVAQTVTVERGA